MELGFFRIIALIDSCTNTMVHLRLGESPLIDGNPLRASYTKLRIRKGVVAELTIQVW